MVVRFATLMVTVAVLAACGQKGPLYLPDKGGEVVTRPGGGQASQQQGPQGQLPGTQTQATPASPPAEPSSDQTKKSQQGQPSPRN